MLAYARSKSKLEVELKYGGHQFSEVEIKAQNDSYWSRDGRTSSCNAAKLRHFLVNDIIIIIIILKFYAILTHSFQKRRLLIRRSASP